MAMSLWPRFFGPLCSRPGGREMKWGFFCKKVVNGGSVFVKKVENEGGVNL